MWLLEFVIGEWICWWRHFTNPVIKYNQNVLQAEQPIRLQYSNQIKLLNDI
jgi:hypothetical protein